MTLSFEKHSMVLEGYPQSLGNISMNALRYMGFTNGKTVKNQYKLPIYNFRRFLLVSLLVPNNFLEKCFQIMGNWFLQFDNSIVTQVAEK